MASIASMPSVASMQLRATEPGDGSYLELIAQAYLHIRPTAMMAAVAYATHSGVAELLGRLAAMDGWDQVSKRWLVGIDFCRSDPTALEGLDGQRRSNVRIYDGLFVVGRDRCIPRVSFHPKLYAFRHRRKEAVVAGSGNLSRTGLCVGVEAGLSVCEFPGKDSRFLHGWFNRQWGLATPLADIAVEYSDRFQSLENRTHPAPTEDDAAPESAGARGQLTPGQLRKLKVCRHLWIQAGNLHFNRGPGRPGNQLMLKRNTRVFFGFPARDLGPDTALGHVAIEFAGNVRHDCSLRFSNNSMDVLTLPVPGADGPAAYSRETICFERIGVRRFRLVLGAPRDLTRWKRRSEGIDGYFRMSRGREWGVF